MSVLGIAWMLAVCFATPQPLSVGAGETARAFALPAVNEDVATEVVNKVQVSLSDFTGVSAPYARSAVVVHFFDRAGGAADLKALNRLQRRFASRGVQVLAISGDADSKAALAKRVDGLRLEYPVLRDNHRVVIGRYGISELPITLVVEGNGNLFAIGQPRGDEIESAIAAELQPLLGR